MSAGAACDSLRRLGLSSHNRQQRPPLPAPAYARQFLSACQYYNSVLLKTGLPRSLCCCLPRNSPAIRYISEPH
ncbi:hypothetical protein DPQ22_05840 [Candidatus Tokpelaia sp.]|nr:hypothetical protein DPQ22_05840 [Candidatus Tokpelaia sp.]